MDFMDDVYALDIKIPKELTDVHLPDPDILRYYKDYDDRVIYVDDDITENTFEITKQIYEYNRVDKNLPVEERKPIVIFIYSYGGDVHQGYALISAIAASKTPVYTVNAGIAMSMGALLLLAGHKRYAMKYSTAMFHPGSSQQVGDYEQIQESQKNYKRTVEMMADYIIERTNITKKRLSANWTKDWYLSSSMQLELGVVSGIIDDLNEVF